MSKIGKPAWSLGGAIAIISQRRFQRQPSTTNNHRCSMLRLRPVHCRPLKSDCRRILKS